MSIGKMMGALVALGLIGGCLGAFDDSDGPTVVTSTTSGVASSVPEIKPPSEPSQDRGEPLPVTAPVGRPVPDSSRGSSVTDGSPADEIDCERAEEYADSGEYEAGDIADYCDYGPDPGELPDEFDWDE